MLVPGYSDNKARKGTSLRCLKEGANPLNHTSEAGTRGKLDKTGSFHVASAVISRPAITVCQIIVKQSIDVAYPGITRARVCRSSLETAAVSVLVAPVTNS